MVVYRITLAKYADGLFASGNPARWNSKDVKMIYTAGSRSLACLENIVHRTAAGLKDSFRTLQISIPDDLPVEALKFSDLEADWRQFSRYPYTQSLGDAWHQRGFAAILKVPSAIIPEEYNYLINPLHKDFGRIQYLGNEPFTFDDRIKYDIKPTW